MKKEIEKTLWFFSFFSLSPTALEVWKTMEGEKADFSETLKILDELVLEGLIIESYGHYKMAGDTRSTHSRRAEAFLDAMRKEKRWRFLLPILSRLPGIQGIALCNLLPLSFTKPTSDIDLFLLVDKERIWTARLFLVGFLRLFRLRPGEAAIDPVDASFFVSEEEFDLSKVKIADEDMYLRFWTRMLLPVFAREPFLFSRFFALNTWAKIKVEPMYSLPKKERWQCPTLGARFEEAVKSWQMKKLPEEVKSRIGESTDVIVRRGILKFHKNDRRLEISSYVQSKMA